MNLNQILVMLGIEEPCAGHLLLLRLKESGMTLEEAKARRQKVYEQVDREFPPLPNVLATLNKFREECPTLVQRHAHDPELDRMFKNWIDARDRMVLQRIAEISVEVFQPHETTVEEWLSLYECVS